MPATKKIVPKKNNYQKAPAKKSSNRFVNNYNKPYRYPGVGRNIGSVVGRTIGGAAGSMIGGPAGGFIGNNIGNLAGGVAGQLAHAGIKTITGFGDYKISENSLVYNRDAVPQFSNSKRCTIVSHREFITDIQGSVNFNIQQFQINPGNAQTFPWLSSLAENYEEWVVQGMVFEFKTTSAMAVSSTNTALGTVIMATQYNSLDPLFINKQQMENYEFAQSGAACESIMHPIECDPKLTSNQGLFYINNPNATAVGDQRLYNIGNFSIATVGMQAISTIGELWVTYKVCFLKPRLASITSGSDHWVLTAASLTSSILFGSTPALSSSSTSYGVNSPTQALSALNNNPWTGVSATNTIYINPSFIGNILVIYQINNNGGAVTWVDPVVTVTGNILYISNPAGSPGLSFYSMQKTPITSYMQITYEFKVNGGFASGVSPAILLSGATITGTIVNGNLVIFPVSNNLIN
nr:MAG: capsid protein [Cressdnaviricota sp.]